MSSEMKTNNEGGFSLVKGFKKLKSKIVHKKLRKSESESDAETSRPLIGSADIKMVKGSTTSRMILLLNCLSVSISLIGSGSIAYKYYRNINYFDVFGGYYGGIILLVTLGVYCVTIFISMAEICWSVIDMFKLVRWNLDVTIHAMWWTAGLFVMQACVILMAHSASENIDDIDKGSFFISMLKFQKYNEVQEKVNQMQSELHCCGTKGHREWFKVTWSDIMDMDSIGFPKSCCDLQQLPMKDCKHITKSQQVKNLTPWNRGCQKVLKEIFLRDLKTIICITPILVGLQLSIFLTSAIDIYWTKKTKVVNADNKRKKALDILEA